LVDGGGMAWRRQRVEAGVQGVVSIPQNRGGMDYEE
jgi:hypothetical protein